MTEPNATHLVDSPTSSSGRRTGASAKSASRAQGGDAPAPAVAPARARVAGEHYTFGDSPVANDRLALLAAVFEPSSARLLRRLAYLQPRYAVDLGCGPGWTTRLLNAVVAPARTVGLDSSAAFLAQARVVAPPGVEYEQHEVTRLPFPGEAPDFLYSRFLLTHLRNPEDVIGAWGRAAANRATLVLEETADIACDHPAFTRYYHLVDRLQASHGQRLRIGADLEGPFDGGWTVELNLLNRLTLPARRMARLHAMNLATWRSDAHAPELFDATELDQLRASLEAVAAGDAPAPDVHQTMRQVVLMKGG